MAASNEVSMDTIVVADLSQLNGNKNIAVSGKHISTLLPSGSGKSCV